MHWGDDRSKVMVMGGQGRHPISGGFSWDNGISEQSEAGVDQRHGE
jgi:hypothetical protein